MGSSASSNPKTLNALPNALESPIITLKSDDDSDQNKWITHQKPDAHHISDNLVQIKDSIWYLERSRYTQCNNNSAMVEFDLITDGVKQTVEFPNNRTSSFVMFAVNGIIYIINSSHDEISYAFNPFTAGFRAIGAKLGQIGESPSVITVGDEIHIYHGRKNNKSLAYIYKPQTNEIKVIKDRFAADRIDQVAMIKYKRKFMRFGGYNWDTDRSYLDWFSVGNGLKHSLLVNGYIRSLNDSNFPLDIINLISMFYDEDNHWKECDDLRLKFGMYGFGYILYEHYIVTFGGCTVRGYIDDIFVLDLENTKYGWNRSYVKCPKKSQYKAIITAKGEVHLFRCCSGPGHYSMPILSVLRACWTFLFARNIDRENIN